MGHGRVIIDSKVDTRALKARTRMSPRPFLALQVRSGLSHLGVVGHVIVVDHNCVVNHLVVVDQLGHFDLNHFDLNLHHHSNLYHYDKEPKNTMGGFEIRTRLN